MSLLLLAAACQTTLPEEPSREATLYRERCGTCHAAYAPSRLKFPTWELIFPRMERRIREAGSPALTPEEKRILLDYLRRNSGTLPTSTTSSATPSGSR